ncbi:hypothetical protein ACOSP7_027300 [Xanthoceras sorbifolium]
MKKIHKCLQQAAKWESVVPPAIRTKIVERQDEASGIPCQHAWAEITVKRLRVKDYMDQYPIRDAYVRLYSHVIHPILSEDQCPKSTQGTVLPLEKRRLARDTKKEQKKSATWSSRKKLNFEVGSSSNAPTKKTVVSTVVDVGSSQPFTQTAPLYSSQVPTQQLQSKSNPSNCRSINVAGQIPNDHEDPRKKPGHLRHPLVADISLLDINFMVHLDDNGYGYRRLTCQLGYLSSTTPICYD